MDHNYSQDDEDFGGRVVYGDDANNHDSEDQSQDERDAVSTAHMQLIKLLSDRFSEHGFIFILACAGSRSAFTIRYCSSEAPWFGRRGARSLCFNGQ
jgi:hypothetical protein